MKKMAFLTITLLAMMAQAQAQNNTESAIRACGELSARTVGPDCQVQAGQACPQFIRKEFYIEANASHGELVVETKSAKILNKFIKMEDDTVCVKGTATKSVEGKAAIEVNSISRVRTSI